VNPDKKSWSSRLVVGHGVNNPTPQNTTDLKPQLWEAMTRKQAKEPYEEEEMEKIGFLCL
jgi:hypothetical protein